MHFKVVTKGFEDSTIDQLLYNTLFLDIHLMLKSPRIMSTNLRTNTVFERRDDASTVGIIFRVGAGDNVYIQRQTNLIPTNLHITLFHNIQQTYLNTLCQVRQLVNTEDAAISARNQTVVDGQLI